MCPRRERGCRSVRARDGYVSPGQERRALKWIIGLGNPGKRYARTRHNIGFWVVDRFASEGGFEGERRKLGALYSSRTYQLPDGSAEKVYVVKPQRYMNLSGPPVRDVMGYFGGKREGDLTESLLVVYDDLDLPEGRLRFRSGGSSGGHRGVASIISCLGHDRFSRLRIGIGRRDGLEAADYVLQAVDRQTESQLEEAARRAANSLSTWIEEGIQSCMNRFNAAPESDPPRGEAFGGDS